MVETLMAKSHDSRSIWSKASALGPEVIENHAFSIRWEVGVFDGKLRI